MLTRVNLQKGHNLSASKCAVATYNKFAERKQQYRKPLNDKLLLDFIRLVPVGTTVVDLGCGFGAEANYLQRCGYNVIAVDISEEVIKKAKDEYPNVQFRVLDFLEVEKIGKEKLGGVFENLSLMNLPKKDIIKMFKKIHSLLDEEGIFQMSIEESNIDESGWYLVPYTKPLRTADGKQKCLSTFLYLSYYTEEELRSSLEGIGFKILKFYKRSQKDVTGRSILTVICSKHLD